VALAIVRTCRAEARPDRPPSGQPARIFPPIRPLTSPAAPANR
jgi:hypothetical protein